MGRATARLLAGFGFVLFTIVLGTTGLGRQANARAKSTVEEDKADIQGVLQMQQAAWNRGDVAAFVTGYWKSPELTFAGSTGVQRGYDQVLEHYQQSYPDRAAMGLLEFSDLEFHFLGKDAALVLGHWHLKRDKDDPGGVFSLVWQRFPEGWKIVHDHTSLVTAKT